LFFTFTTYFIFNHTIIQNKQPKQSSSAVDNYLGVYYNRLAWSVGKSAQIPTWLYTPKGSLKMLHCKQQSYNSVWVWADSQDELGMTFMRPQEHYESFNPLFKNKVFTLGQLKNWYSETYGANDYHTTWIGYNFPSRVLLPFKQGLFDPLTDQENRLLDLFRYRNDNYYIIGAQNNSTLRHELSHALYGFDNKYKNEIDNYINKYKKGFGKIIKHLLEKGYDKSVLNDELQAYVTDNDDEFIRTNLDPVLINGIISIYKRYRKHDKKLG
jgi:hypothetical protein